MNALADRWERRYGWMWFPLGSPASDRPISAARYAWLVVLDLATDAAVTRAIRALPDPPSRRRERVERALTVSVEVALLLVWAGAWDRRAATPRGRLAALRRRLVPQAGAAAVRR